jgi:hypothetical protein
MSDLRLDLDTDGHGGLQDRVRAVELAVARLANLIYVKYAKVN